MSPRATSLLLVLAGCQTTAISSPGVDVTGSTGNVSAGTQQPTGFSDGTSSDTTTGESTAGTSGMFVMEPDGGGSTWTCDPWLQDCGDGEKCAYVSSDGTGFDGSRCVPLDPDPKASWEPCVLFGAALRGLDDCAPGHSCSPAPPGATNGICLPYCNEHEQCPDPMGWCPLMGSASLLCYPKCDPLVVDDCGSERACVLSGGGFVCSAWRTGSLGASEPCTGDWDCREGHLCTYDAEAPGCATSCCQPLCDIAVPDGCPLAASGQECMSLGLSGRNWSHVGVCEFP